jgi:hypothetical protein
LEISISRASGGSQSASCTAGTGLRLGSGKVVATSVVMARRRSSRKRSAHSILNSPIAVLSHDLRFHLSIQASGADAARTESGRVL